MDYTLQFIVAALVAYVLWLVMGMAALAYGVL